jgi:hypothetical protein
MEQFMEQSTPDGSRIPQPLVDEVDHPLVSDSARNTTITRCLVGRHNVRLPVNRGHLYFRRKWLQKLFNLLNAPAD